MDSLSDPSVHRSDSGFDQRHRFPVRSKDRRSHASPVEYQTPSLHSSRRMEEGIRSFRQSGGPSPRLSQKYQNSPDDGAIAMASSHRIPPGPHLSFGRRESLSGLVVPREQPDPGGSLLSQGSGCDYSHGRIQTGVGGPSGGHDGRRHMVSGRSTTSHQHLGAQGSFSDLAEVRELGEEPSSRSPHGQHDGSSVREQAGGNGFVLPVPPYSGPTSLVLSEGYRPVGNTPRGGEECLGGCVVPRENDSDRVDVEQACGQGSLPQVGISPFGPIRLRGEPPTSNILLSFLLPSEQRNQCADSELGHDVGLRLPSDLTDPSGTQKDPASPVSNDLVDRPVLAEPNLVQRSDGSADRAASQPPGEGNPSSTPAVPRVVPEPGVAALDCMGTVCQSFQEEGFSPEAAAIAAGARRQSTQQLYNSRLGVFERWCRDRSIDPRSSSVGQVSEFLRGLATSPWHGKTRSFNTIANYRSAIGAIHKGFGDGSTVSSNTLLSTFMKGLFSQMATVKTLNPSWELPVVLEWLSKPPFEPMVSASLLNLARKTAFLIQLASGRRVSFTHAIRIDEGFLRWDSDGVRLRPDIVIDKNQSASFSPEPVFLGDLKLHSPDDKVHCPCRALKWYLKRTENDRGRIQHLFLMSVRPFSRASKATVGRWIKSVIVDSHKEYRPDFSDSAAV